MGESQFDNRTSETEASNGQTIKSPGSVIAEAIAAVHGTVPIQIVGSPSDPAVGILLRKLKKARSIPPGDTFRCKS